MGKSRAEARPLQRQGDEALRWLVTRWIVGQIRVLVERPLTELTEHRLPFESQSEKSLPLEERRAQLRGNKTGWAPRGSG